MPTIGEVAGAEAEIFEERVDALKAMYVDLGHSAIADRYTAERARDLYERALTSIINSGIIISGLSEDSELEYAGHNSSSLVYEVAPLRDIDKRRLSRPFEPVHFFLSVPGISPEQDSESREVQPRIFFRHGNFGYAGILDDIEWHRAEKPEEVTATA